MNPNLHNAHLEGEPFFWEGGEIGVLLLHGFTATPAEVRPLAENLAKAGFSVAGPMLAGHGTHPEDLNRTHWQEWVDSADKAYQNLRRYCKRVFIGGASMGGLVALMLATEHLEAGGVICFAPAIKLTTPPLRIAGLHLAAPFVKQMARSSLDNPEKWQGYPGLPLKGAVQLFRLQRIVRGRLNRVNQPVLVFQGRMDRTVAPETGDIIMRGISSKIKEHRWMERSTHEVTLDDELPEVTRLVIDFINRCAQP